MTKMKDSGVEWIGQIPEDWTLPKVKNLFNIGRGRVIAQTELDDDGKYPVYSSQTQNDGCLGYINSYDFDVDQLTWTTDGANAGTVFLRTGKHNCTNVCGTLQQKNNDNSLKYLKYALEFIAIYHKRADTNGFKIMNNEMAEIIIPVPSLNIQKKIADFLDKKCGEIDRLIEIQEQEIEKLKEYKTSVITKAVTKGLDDSVPMKDSGNMFLGKVPLHWKVNRVKFFADNFSKGNGITKEEIVIDGDSPCVRYGEIYTKYEIAFNQCLTRTNKDKFKALQYFSYGDILFSCTGELVEEIGKNIVYLGNEQCLAGGYIIVMKHSQNPLFMSYSLNSSVSQVQKSYGKAKLKVVHISAFDISNIYITIPPIKEQNDIVNYLDIRCQNIDKTILLKHQKIEKLQEYKKSLIYEYVTGKKEVV